MHETRVKYDDIIAGKHTRRSGHPFEAYFRERGARVRTNVFCDPSLRTDDNVLLNLVRIIRSGRAQGFEKLVIRVPKTYLEYYLKIARQLMVIGRVVIESTEDSDDVVYHIYFPDIIWIESAYWEPRSRTNLHPRHLTKDQHDQIKAMFDLHNPSDDERRLLLKAIDLDEKVLDEE